MGRIRHVSPSPQGLMTGTSSPSKCLVFRVAIVARRASAMPAISVSRRLHVRPSAGRQRAAPLSPRPPNRSRARDWRGRLSGRSRTPARVHFGVDPGAAGPSHAVSTTVMLDSHTESAGWRSNQSTTASGFVRTGALLGRPMLPRNGAAALWAPSRRTLSTGSSAAANGRATRRLTLPARDDRRRPARRPSCAVAGCRSA